MPEMPEPEASMRLEYKEFDPAGRLAMFLADEYLLDDAVAEARMLARTLDVRLNFERVLMDDWPAPAQGRLVCYSFQSRDQRDVESEAARQSGLCVICRRPTGDGGTATCRSQECLRRWLLPASARR